MNNPDTGHQLVNVTTNVATTEAIPYRRRGGEVHIPSGSSITSLTWSSLDPVNSQRDAAYSEDGTTAVVQSGLAAGKAYPIPDALFGCATLYAVGNAAGTIVITFKG